MADLMLKWWRVDGRWRANGSEGRKYTVERDHGLWEPLVDGLHPGSDLVPIAQALNLVGTLRPAQDVCEALERVARYRETLDRLSALVAKTARG